MFPITYLSPLALQPTDSDAALGVTIKYTAAQLRAFIGAVAVPGVSRKNDLNVTQRAQGSNMSIDVAAGDCVVAGTSVALQGSYFCQSTASANIPIATAQTSGTRTDLIVAQVYDKQIDGGSSYSWTVQAITGTVNGGVPTVPVNSLLLAQVGISASQSSVTSANITDVRTLNLMIDGPQWQLKGGNGQLVPNGANTTYTGWTYSNLIGVGTNGNQGEIVIRQGGQYLVTFTGQMDYGGNGSALRRVYIDHLSPTGVFIERIGQQDQYPGAGLTSAPGPAQTASGTAVCAINDVLRARSYHLAGSGVTLHLDDTNSVLRFTGFLAGPAD